MWPSVTGLSIDHIPTYFCPRSYWMTPNPLSLPPQHKQITSLREKCSTNPQEILNPVCTGHWMNSNVCSIMCVSSSKSFIKPWRLEETKLSRDSGHTVILELFNLKEFKHFLVYLPVFLDRNTKHKYFLKYYDYFLRVGTNITWSSQPFLKNCQIGTFNPLQEIWKFSRPSTF